MKNTINNILIISISSLLIFGGLIKEKNGKSSFRIQTGLITEQDTSIKSLPEGYLYISNFSLKKNKKIKSISQDSLGVMLFADNTGVTFFDGTNETNLFIKNTPNSILKDKYLNRFYLACKKGYGIIEKDISGQYSYKNLSQDSRHNENYYKVISNKNKIYFISQNKIVSIDSKNIEKNKIEYLDEIKGINYAFIFNEKLHINIDQSGLHILQNDSIIPILKDKRTANSNILFHIPNNKSVIIGTDNNEIFSFNGKKLSSFNTGSSDYIKESIVTGAVNYNNKIFAVTTLNGGAVIINKETSETEHTINYRTGLPDDEILTSFTDNFGGLWLAHEYGISRVAFDIPVKNFGNYPGIQGKINSLKVVDSILYVATGEGLFYLSEIKSYEEVKIATDKWIQSKTKLNNIQKNISEAEFEETEMREDILKEEKTEESGFFKRWKRRKDKKNKEKDIESELENAESDKNVLTENTAAEETEDEETVTVSDKPRTNTERENYKTTYKKVTEYRKIYELQSIKYSYKKIEGINSKCKSLKKFNNGLLAVTNSGLYFVDGFETTPIIEDTYIFNISGEEKENMVFASTSEGIYRIFYFDGRFIPEKIENDNPDNKKLRTLYKKNDSILWASILNKIYRYKIINNRITSTEQYFINTDRNEEIYIGVEDDKILFLAKDQAFYYNQETDNILEYPVLNTVLRDADNVFPVSDTSFIITTQSRSTHLINLNNDYPYLKYAWLFDKISALTIDDDQNIWVMTRDNMIYKISREDENITHNFQIIINDVKDNDGNSILNPYSINVESNYKRLVFELSSPYYLKNDFVTYYYGIDTENEDEFIEFSRSKLTIPELTPGYHSLYIYAVNDINEKSETVRIDINVKPPIWQTIWFIAGVFVIFVLLISFIISSFYRRKQRKIREYNEILELKVKERTAEIEKQNGLIQEQNVEIMKQNKHISIQNEEITGSIRYAGRIQTAALPDTEIHSKYLSGFFIFYKPRDIVSGDFYWITEAQKKLYIAAVDCTGHGVPGGFLSMLGISFLNEIVKDLVKNKNEIKAADVLSNLREKVIKTLSHQRDSTTQDGMDMSLVIFDKEKMMLNYAGANNPAYIIRNNKLTKLAADRMPIGFNKKFNEVDFNNKFVKLIEGDSIYIFSDGYADQFGGQFGKKFNSRRFRELLVHIQKFPMDQQKDVVETIFGRWKNKNIQVDDILLIGLQI